MKGSMNRSSPFMPLLSSARIRPSCLIEICHSDTLKHSKILEEVLNSPQRAKRDHRVIKEEEIVDARGSVSGRLRSDNASAVVFTVATYPSRVYSMPDNTRVSRRPCDGRNMLVTSPSPKIYLSKAVERRKL